MKMRRNFYSGITAGILAIALCAVFATTASAQDPKAEAYFQKYMAANPELQRNPGLINNPAWLNAHPDFHKFLENHPAIANQAHSMGGYGNYGNQAGAYDNHHHWHNRDWWVKNNPNWVKQNQPGWMMQRPPGYGTGTYANSPNGYPPPGGYPHPGGYPAGGGYPNAAGYPNAGHPPYPNPGTVGAYDTNHQWHDRSWWMANNRTWVQTNHPEWMHH